MNLILTIVTPVSQTTLEVEWLEVETPVGNRIFLPHHAPFIAALKSRSIISFKVADGSTDTRFAYSGVVEVNRTHANVILNDATAN